MQDECACACVSLPIPSLLLLAKARHIHNDKARHCMPRWRFAQTSERIYNQGSAEVLPDADVKDLGRLLSQKGYQVFRQGPSLYAFKGLAGRLGPIGVHASMLAIMAGVAIGGLGGFKGSVMVPQGGDFLVAQVTSVVLIISRLLCMAQQRMGCSTTVACKFGSTIVSSFLPQTILCTTLDVALCLSCMCHTVSKLPLANLLPQTSLWKQCD